MLFFGIYIKLYLPLQGMSIIIALSLNIKVKKVNNKLIICARWFILEKTSINYNMDHSSKG